MVEPNYKVGLVAGANSARGLRFVPACHKKLRTDHVWETGLFVKPVWTHEPWIGQTASQEADGLQVWNKENCCLMFVTYSEVSEATLGMKKRQ